MHDYIVGGLMRDRQAGFLREVEHAELVAEAKRAALEQPKTPAVFQAEPAHETAGHAWKARLAHLRLRGVHLPLHHA